MRLLKFWRPPFFVAGEQKIFEMLQLFLRHITDSVSWLDKSADCVRRSSNEELKKSVEKVSEHEQRADDVRRGIEKLLYEERFFDREEKIDLIEHIDDVADYAEMAADAFLFRELDLPPQMCGLLCEMTSAAKRCAASMRHAVISLYSDFAKTREYANMAEEERDKVRKAYSKLMTLLFNSNLPAVTVMLLRDIAFRVARTADMAEEASDWARFLAAKYA